MYYYQCGVVEDTKNYEFQALEHKVQLLELKSNYPRINNQIIERLTEHTEKMFLKKIKETYEEWWFAIQKFKSFDKELNDLYEKFKFLFNDEITIQSNISDKFNEFFESGFMNGELYVVSAPSGVGKTAFSIMQTAILISGFNPFLKKIKQFDNKKVVYVSLEQSKNQINARIKSALMGLNDLVGAVSYAEILKSSNKLADILYYTCEQNLVILTQNDFDDSTKIDEILKVVENHIDENSLVIIDQFENIEGATNPQSDFIPIKLKEFCADNVVPMLVQVQLNKQSLKNSQKKDGTHDGRVLNGNSIRGTSGVEHQASGIFMVVDTGAQIDVSGMIAKELTISLVKNRYGITTQINLWHIGALNLFMDSLQVNDEENLNVKI